MRNALVACLVAAAVGIGFGPFDSRALAPLDARALAQGRHGQAEPAEKKRVEWFDVAK
jgi:hypothetical protein